MGKPGNKNQSAISNVFRKAGGAYDVSKDRYTDPIVPGVGSPYDQTGWQTLKEGIKKVAIKARDHVKKEYPKVAETLTSIGQSSPLIPDEVKQKAAESSNQQTKVPQKPYTGSKGGPKPQPKIQQKAKIVKVKG